MRICLLTTQDLDADPFPDDDWPCDPRPFLPEAEWTVAILKKPTTVRTVIKHVRKRFDVYFNLCDGAWDENKPGLEVVKTLERMGVPFTGARSEFYEPSRDAMKWVCRDVGIDTPAGVMVDDLADVERVLATLRFPMIVKHPNSYASIGLTPDSRVETPQALEKQVRRMFSAYGGALVEEFIEGDEYTVLVAENPDDAESPIVYRPFRYRFSEGDTFKHEDAKWIEYSGMKCDAIDDPALEARIRSDASRLFVGLNGAGFGRCDIRVDAKGRAFMLEINANCGVYYPPADAGGADLCLLDDPGGHEAFTRRLVEAAFRRHERSVRNWVIRLRDDARFGLFASRPIRRGERILSQEEQPHEIVSRSHVKRTWSKARKAWFRRHAWPLTDEIWAVRSADPETWTPIRHACDPSAWWTGLDVTARRKIADGEEITLDYATFRNKVMPSFRCNCGAKTCRKTIRGTDHLQDFVSRYGRHVSEYVRGARTRLPRSEVE